MAMLYQDQGRYADAETLYKRALIITEKAQGPDHPDVGNRLNNLAMLYFVQRDWPRAADYWRRSTALLQRRAERGTADVGKAITGKSKSEGERRSFRFGMLIKTAHRLAAQDHGAEATLAREMFETGQWAQSSEAAGSLAQMAARGAKAALV
jgi:tetratricopeptide (TPR) repeat protein